MRHLSVIGLGAMGSALATTLLKADHPVTVWNRSVAKAAPLQALGATLAPSVGAAIAASDITLVCVDNYAVSQQLLDEARDAVAGKLLVQLSTGSRRGPERWRAGATPAAPVISMALSSASRIRSAPLMPASSVRGPAMPLARPSRSCACSPQPSTMWPRRWAPLRRKIVPSPPTLPVVCSVPCTAP
ncbi:MAG: NAD(P)-binding domain-containing protein [Aeromonas veronii]